MRKMNTKALDHNLQVL